LILGGQVTTLRQFYLRTSQNLNILREREARQGLNADLALVNQISDHETALALLEAALEQPLTPAQFDDLKKQLRPLLLASNVEQVSLYDLRQEKPRLNFEPDTIVIPAGPFIMGSADGEPDEAPAHQLSLPAYAIGRTPVTVGQYAEFIRQETGQSVPRRMGWFSRRPPADKLDHPVAGVNWYEAQAYCRWLSQQSDRRYRLPTEAEWEKAAAWMENNAVKYPWGNNFEPDRCNSAEAGLDTTTPVGQYSPAGDSPAGCVDMAGNVQEWVNTLWGYELHQADFVYPYRPDDGREQGDPGDGQRRSYRLYRSSAYRDGLERLRCAARGHSDPDSRPRWRGFRVVMEISQDEERF
jgi:formylglycine-generating enzyme required for sulfatase activity